MRTLVTIPSLVKPGGVANYYQVLRSYLPDSIEYFTVGAQEDREGLYKLLLRFLRDYRSYYHTLKHGNYDLVHLNPSLGPKALIRDGIFLIIAKSLHIKTVVFIRGWDAQFERTIRRFYLSVFRFVYWKADAFIVLGTVFRDKLIDMKCTKPIYIESTVVDDTIFSRPSCNDITNPASCGNPGKNILILTRIEKSKGVNEAIDSFRILKERIPDATLTVAGDGPELQALKHYVHDMKIADIHFPGFVSGSQKQALFENADLFLFPTSYGEGMPNAVLEAMAYGLPVVTRPVGGMRDFFENGHMGFITDSLDPAILAGLIEKLIQDNDKRMQIGTYNRQYARENFRASAVSGRLQKLYKMVLADTDRT
jgi:glycosyltransferase involved in cell wall biosynthesis